MIDHASRPVTFTPLALPLLREYDETHTDGSNAFIYSRFLVPYLCGYKGWAIFADGDMLLRDDIAKLWQLRSDAYGVQVVKHDYQTRHKQKYIGTDLQTVNQSYPRKNWSSLMIWNCEHPENRILTPEYVMGATGQRLHRFEHLRDEDIGPLPAEWNHLVGEQPFSPDAKLVHYTLGVPIIPHYRDCDYSEEWMQTYEQVKAAP